MPHHPSLEEVLDKKTQCEEEWAEFVVKGLSWSVWVSSERVIGAQPTPVYNFACNSLSSEMGTFSRENVILNFEITTEENETLKQYLGAFKAML